MIFKTITLSLSLSCAVALLSLGSCHKTVDYTYSQIGLQTNRNYNCDTVIHDHALRMFTQDGEVTDTGVINHYLALRPDLVGTESAAELHPALIFPTQTNLVYYNGLVPYITSIDNGVLEMRQTDTSKSGATNPNGTIDPQFGWQQSFAALRDAVLETNNSYFKLERLDPSSYRSLESYRIKGSYANETITLPYTFVASRIINRSYPFALKPNLAPPVTAGDTLLVQEGRVAFKMN